MSRSRKKPYLAIACYKSNKTSKKWAHRAFRSRERQALKGTKEFPYRMREISDVWDFASDGLPFYPFGDSWSWEDEWKEKLIRK